MGLWFETALLPGGWADRVQITLATGRIASVEADVEPQPGDERHAIAIPGLCNVHSHAFQRAMAGLTEYRGTNQDNFWTWRVLMYRFLERLDPDDVEAIAAQAYAEMLECGFTRVGEFHYLHHDANGRAYTNLAELAERIAGATQETGIGLTLLPVFYAQGGFGAKPPDPGQRRFLTTPVQYAHLFEACRTAIKPLDDARMGVAPHSLRAVTPEQLGEISPLAENGPIHIHAAEQIKEVEDCVAWSGRRPVEWLLDEAQVDDRWCLVHATHMSESETERLARSGAVAGLCPITEANLGDGIFPAAEYFNAAGYAGIGTDSNVLIDAAEELRALEYAQRLKRRSRNVLASTSTTSTGRTVFGAALAGGARALGVADFGLRVGASADIVALGAHHPSLIAHKGDQIFDSWIFAAGRSAVETVWRYGHKVVDAGQHIHAGQIRARYRRTLVKLLAA